MSDSSTHLQTQKVGVKSEQEDNTNNDQLEVSGEKKVKLGRKRGPWGTTKSDLDSILDEYNAREKKGTLIGKVGKETETVQRKKTRVWKIILCPMSQEIFDKYRAEDLTEKTAKLSVDKLSNTSTTASESGKTGNYENTSPGKN